MLFLATVPEAGCSGARVAGVRRGVGARGLAVARVAGLAPSAVMPDGAAGGVRESTGPCLEHVPEGDPSQGGAPATAREAGTTLHGWAAAHTRVVMRHTGCDDRRAER